VVRAHVVWKGEGRVGRWGQAGGLGWGRERAWGGSGNGGSREDGDAKDGGELARLGGGRRNGVVCGEGGRGKYGMEERAGPR